MIRTYTHCLNTQLNLHTLYGTAPRNAPTKSSLRYRHCRVVRRLYVCRDAMQGFSGDSKNDQILVPNLLRCIEFPTSPEAMNPPCISLCLSDNKPNPFQMLLTYETAKYISDKSYRVHQAYHAFIHPYFSDCKPYMHSLARYHTLVVDASAGTLPETELHSHCASTYAVSLRHNMISNYYPIIIGYQLGTALDFISAFRKSQRVWRKSRASERHRIQVM